jgi:hypothetical protein
VSRVSRYVVVHEAGHAVLALIGCRAVYGNDGAFDFIEVRRSGDYTPIKTRRGKLIHARGIVAGCQLWKVRLSKDENGEWCEGHGEIGFIAQAPESCRVNYLMRATAAARVSLAGPCAQAELRRQSLPRILKQYGMDDYQPCHGVHPGCLRYRGTSHRGISTHRSGDGTIRAPTLAGDRSPCRSFAETAPA